MKTRWKYTAHRKKSNHSTNNHISHCAVAKRRLGRFGTETRTAVGCVAKALFDKSLRDDSAKYGGK